MAGFGFVCFDDVSVDLAVLMALLGAGVDRDDVAGLERDDNARSVIVNGRI